MHESTVLSCNPSCIRNLLHLYGCQGRDFKLKENEAIHMLAVYNTAAGVQGNQ